MNKLYFGDNLDWLPKIKEESVDLIYLDPPFNSKSTYNVLYKSPLGADSQKKAFEDTWHWEDGAESAMEAVRRQNTTFFRVLQSLQGFLGQSDLMAYLAMMAVRMIELHRVLKPTGSLYLHCDPTASHYLKILLDSIFGATNFVNEITWKRSASHNDSKQGSAHFGRVHDTLLFYCKNSAKSKWNQLWNPHKDGYLKSHYTQIDEQGRRFRWDDLTGPGGEGKGNPFYEVLGVPGFWRYSKEKMRELVETGMVSIPAKGTKPSLKRYLDEQKGTPVSDVWDDIPPVNSQAQERLGYPTQKPLALLERLIAASTNVGDVVLDPFCGCGTAVHAAERLGRKWIGIDVTYLAIQVIEDRLCEWLPNAKYTVEGIPKDEFSARKLAALEPFVFQQWAVGRLGGQSRGRGPDKGIDGEIIFLRGRKNYGRAIVSVKAGKHVGPDAVRILKDVVRREDAEMGVLVCLNSPTPDMRTEASLLGKIELPGGERTRIQIVTAKDLVAGPNLGILTELNTIAVAREARTVQRRKPPRRPTAEDLRNEPPLPPMALTGGASRKSIQPALDLNDPVLIQPQPNRRGRRKS